MEENSLRNSLENSSLIDSDSLESSFVQSNSLLSERPKLAYFSWDFAKKIKNIYPDYDFVPFIQALSQKKTIRACIGYKGRGAFIAKLFGFDFWALNEGIYRLSSKKPSSFVLEQFGDYHDAREPSEWEEWVKSMPILLKHFQKLDTVLEKNKQRSLIEQDTSYCLSELSPTMQGILRRLPSAFPALSPYRLDEVKENLDELLKYRLGSDRYAPDATPYQLYTASSRKRVVILDDVRMSKNDLAKVLATEKSFVQMLSAAKKENPGAAFFLLEPKSVRTNKKKGYLRKLAEANGIKVLSADVSSISILEQAEIVYTVGSDLGLDAILLGKKVRCFGMPFYAGFGLTKDEITLERRNVIRTKEELFAAIALFFTRYRHPITEEAGSFQELLHFIILQRPQKVERNRYIACIHFNTSLQTFCQRFFSYSQLHFMSQDKAIVLARENKGMIFTAKEPDDAMREACGNIPLVFVNVGVLDRLLGHENLVSLSLEGGPYPPLERILQTVKPEENDLLRARLFRQYMREISAFRTHFNFNHVPEHKEIVLLLGNSDLVPVALKNKRTENDFTRKKTYGNLDHRGLPVNSLTSPLADDAALIEHIRELRKDAHIVYCPQAKNVNVPESILALVDDVKPFARPSDFVPLSVLGIMADPCELADLENPDNSSNNLENCVENEFSDISPAFVIDESVECLPNFEGADYTKWSRKHIAAKRFLEKAHNMTTVNGQFCPLYFPLKSVGGRTVEVHTCDSYLGLDALAVSMKVYTYGWPIYAGWGLTVDAEEFPLRKQSLVRLKLEQSDNYSPLMTLERLFAGLFILQPRYFDSVNDIFCEPENSPYLLMRDTKKR